VPDAAASPTLAEILTLSPADVGPGAEGADTFLGTSPPERRPRVFGGQVVARRVVDTAGAGRFDTMFRASLDHAIWFHRPPRIDDWVLYDIEAASHRDDRILTWGRIPNFAGAEAAAERLREHPAWQAARTVKSNPDSPQRPVRQRALEDGKDLIVTPEEIIDCGAHHRAPAAIHWHELTDDKIAAIPLLQRLAAERR